MCFGPLHELEMSVLLVFESRSKMNIERTISFLFQVKKLNNYHGSFQPSWEESEWTLPLFVFIRLPNRRKTLPLLFQTESSNKGFGCAIWRFFPFSEILRVFPNLMIFLSKICEFSFFGITIQKKILIWHLPVTTNLDFFYFSCLIGFCLSNIQIFRRRLFFLFFFPFLKCA